MPPLPFPLIAPTFKPSTLCRDKVKNLFSLLNYFCTCFHVKMLKVIPLMLL